MPFFSWLIRLPLLVHRRLLVFSICPVVATSGALVATLRALVATSEALVATSGALEATSGALVATSGALVALVEICPSSRASHA